MTNSTVNPVGVYTANLTPLNPDLSVNMPLLVKHCQWLLAQGSQGIAFLGTTGEATSFSLGERKAALEGLLQGGIDPSQIMVGAGCTNHPDTIALTRHALDHGVSDILLLPPYYYKQVDDQGLLDYFRTVIESVADPALQIYLYHFPKMSGIHMSVDFVAHLADLYPNNVVGMKDSSGDVNNMIQVCQTIPGFQLFAGTERYLLDVLRAGGAGCISATANVTITLAAKVFRHWQSDQGDHWQQYLTQVRSCFDGLPFSAVLKQYLAHRRKDPRWLYLRPPLSPVSDETLHELLRQLSILKFEAAGVG